jgi:hypothetical protein
MSEESKAQELRAVWRGRPEEKLPVNPERFVSRRTRDLSSSTRSEIAMSIGSVLFFAAIVALRFASAHERIQRLGLAAAIPAIAWVLISLYWFRDRIWRADAPREDALAAACREYYRKELERRRDHLRNVWLWHGPLFLACLISAAVFLGIGKAFPGFERLRNALPLVVLLAVWTGFGLRRRRRQAKQIQQEIDEIDRL